MMRELQVAFLEKPFGAIKTVISWLIVPIKNHANTAIIIIIFITLEAMSVCHHLGEFSVFIQNPYNTDDQGLVAK